MCTTSEGESSAAFPAGVSAGLAASGRNCLTVVTGLDVDAVRGICDTVAGTAAWTIVRALSFEYVSRCQRLIGDRMDFRRNRLRFHDAE